jgi:hypothetical protein
MERPGNTGNVTTKHGLASCAPVPPGLSTTADDILRDFKRLVLILHQTMAIAEVSEDDLLKRLSCTKIVAERGLRLSERLLELVRSKSD